MEKNVIINALFYIKRTVLKVDMDSIAELIYVTKENNSSRNGISLVTPEILASHIREIPVDEVTQESLSFTEGESMVYITEEQAHLLSELVTVDKAFLKEATIFFQTLE